MAKQNPRRDKPVQARPPPPSLAELMEQGRRIQAQTQETLRQLVALQQEILIARQRQDERERT